MVAAVGAVLGGFVDHRIGSKPVIVGSLVVIVVVELALMALSGPVAFWVGGLLLALFIGPAQSSSRALLLQMAEHGKEGVAFGLYTMTGRAVAFIAPWLFSVFVDVFGAVRAGLGRHLAGAARRACWRCWWSASRRAARLSRWNRSRTLGQRRVADRDARSGALAHLDARPR